MGKRFDLYMTYSESYLRSAAISRLADLEDKIATAMLMRPIYYGGKIGSARLLDRFIYRMILEERYLYQLLNPSPFMVQDHWEKSGLIVN